MPLPKPPDLTHMRHDPGIETADAGSRSSVRLRANPVQRRVRLIASLSDAAALAAPVGRSIATSQGAPQSSARSKRLLLGVV